MAKDKKKTTNTNKSNNQHEEQNPEVTERIRLKKLANTNHIISQTPAKLFSSLNPSKTVVKHHGKDIMKKSQRKNRYLLSFSGLVAPVSGGRIGELSDLGSKNPKLYLEFPQGRMKLCGTIIYPKNRYLSLQFSRGGKNVMCEDCFDSMIVFSEAYWVGKKDENPEEARLDFPEELYEKKQSEFDFQGGVGAGAAGDSAAIPNKTVRKPVAKKCIESESLSDLPLDDMETDSPEREDNVIQIEHTTPSRHSERTAGKRFKFAEVSSGDDSAESADEANDEDVDEANDEGSDKANDQAVDVLITDQNLGITKTTLKVPEFEDIKTSTEKAPQSSTLRAGEKKSSRSSLVQTSISSLFKKVEQKGAAEDATKIVPNKASKKSAQSDTSKSKNKLLTKQLFPKAAEKLNKDDTSQVKKTRARDDGKKQKEKIVEDEDDDDDEDEDDDIEEFSSPLEENDESSDDDWRA